MTCECGCGAVLPVGRRFVHNHHRRGQSNQWKLSATPETRDESVVHKEARRLKRSVQDCEWRPIGGCKGRLQVAHVDGDPWNNELGNLKKLCQSHHALLDGGRIDPAAPAMPAFHVSRDGKRRYRHAVRYPKPPRLPAQTIVDPDPGTVTDPAAVTG